MHTLSIRAEAWVLLWFTLMCLVSLADVGLPTPHPCPRLFAKCSHHMPLGPCALCLLLPAVFPLALTGLDPILAGGIVRACDRPCLRLLGALQFLALVLLVLRRTCLIAQL